jgi:hypothetical protein
MDVRWKNEKGIPVLCWSVSLGNQLMLQYFQPSITVDATWAGAPARHFVIRGTGPDRYPFLNVILLDLDWQETLP